MLLYNVLAAALLYTVCVRSNDSPCIHFFTSAASLAAPFRSGSFLVLCRFHLHRVWFRRFFFFLICYYVRIASALTGFVKYSLIANHKYFERTNEQRNQPRKNIPPESGFNVSTFLHFIIHPIGKQSGGVFFSRSRLS